MGSFKGESWGSPLGLEGLLLGHLTSAKLALMSL